MNILYRIVIKEQIGREGEREIETSCVIPRYSETKPVSHWCEVERLDHLLLLLLVVCFINVIFRLVVMLQQKRRAVNNTIILRAITVLGMRVLIWLFVCHLFLVCSLYSFAIHRMFWAHFFVCATNFSTKMNEKEGHSTRMMMCPFAEGQGT